MAKKTRYIDIADGDGICAKSGQDFYLTCCDCSLTHKIKVHIVNREVTLMITRDERRTSQKRRRIKDKQKCPGYAVDLPKNILTPSGKVIKSADLLR